MKINYNQYVLYAFYVIVMAFVIVAAYLTVLDKSTATVLIAGIIGNALGINVLPPALVAKTNIVPLEAGVKP
jgi:hypothetical protein